MYDAFTEKIQLQIATRFGTTKSCAWSPSSHGQVEAPLDQARTSRRCLP